MISSTAPRSIKLFAVAYLGQALVSAAHRAFRWYWMQTQTEQLMELAYGDGTPWTAGVLVIRLSIVALLVWLVVARASRLAKWAAIVLTLGRPLQLFNEWSGLTDGLASGNPNSIAWTVESLLCLVAVISLFVGGSPYWFKNKGRSIRADAAAFD